MLKHNKVKKIIKTTRAISWGFTATRSENWNWAINWRIKIVH